MDRTMNTVSYLEFSEWNIQSTVEHYFIKQQWFRYNAKFVSCDNKKIEATLKQFKIFQSSIAEVHITFSTFDTEGLARL